MKTEYNFPVELKPVFISGKKDSYVEIPRKKAVVRTDINSTLGVVSNKYSLVSHEEVVNGFRNALKKTDYTEKIEMARNGAFLFATYRLNSEKFEVQKGDVVSLQFVVKNSYDGMNSLQVMFGAFRLVCSNGMILGKEMFTYTKKHMGSESSLNKDFLIERITLLAEQFHQVAPIMQTMSRTKITTTQEDRIFNPKQVHLPTYLLTQAQERYSKEKDTTVWGYYNALTASITHGLRTREGALINPQMYIKYGKVAWKSAQQLIK